MKWVYHHCIHTLCMLYHGIIITNVMSNDVCGNGLSRYTYFLKNRLFFVGIKITKKALYY